MTDLDATEAQARAAERRAIAERLRLVAVSGALARSLVRRGVVSTSEFGRVERALTDLRSVAAEIGQPQ